MPCLLCQSHWLFHRSNEGVQGHHVGSQRPCVRRGAHHIRAVASTCSTRGASSWDYDGACEGGEAADAESGAGGAGGRAIATDARVHEAKSRKDLYVCA